MLGGWERGEQPERGVGDGAPARVGGEVFGFVGVKIGGELLVGRRDCRHPHVPPEFAVVVGARDLLGLAQAPPAEPVDPPDRDDDERGQHVHEIVVGDRVGAVHLVHAADRGASPRAGEAVFQNRVEDE